MGDLALREVLSSAAALFDGGGFSLNLKEWALFFLKGDELCESYLYDFVCEQLNKTMLCILSCSCASLDAYGFYCWDPGLRL